MPLAERVALLGERISLAQLALRLTAPGVPDFYQGDECWNYSLVDPDNRRPVDWEHGREILAALHSDAFAASYLALGSGPTTCAYQRGSDVVVAVSIRDRPLAAELPDGEWTNLLGGLEQAYDSIPVAVFERRSQ